MRQKKKFGRPWVAQFLTRAIHFFPYNWRNKITFFGWWWWFLIQQLQPVSLIIGCMQWQGRARGPPSKLNADKSPPIAKCRQKPINCLKVTAADYWTKLKVYKPTHQLPSSNTSILCFPSVCTHLVRDPFLMLHHLSGIVSSLFLPSTLLWGV